MVKIDPKPSEKWSSLWLAERVLAKCERIVWLGSFRAKPSLLLITRALGSVSDIVV